MADKKLPKGPEFVTKNEFNAFADRVVGLLENAVMPQQTTVVVDPLAPTMHVPAGMQATLASGSHVGVAPQYSPFAPHPDTVSPDARNGLLPAQYQSMFDRFFDPMDGFEGRLNFPEIDEKGNENGGITFTVVVPMKFSNTDDGYRKMYKADLRTRALMPNNIAKGMEDWCTRVVKNLNYKRNMQSK